MHRDLPVLLSRLRPEFLPFSSLSAQEGASDNQHGAFYDKNEENSSYPATLFLSKLIEHEKFYTLMSFFINYVFLMK